MNNTDRIGVIAGISGEAVTKELKKLDKKVFLICGRDNEPGFDLADGLFVADFSEQERIKNYLQAENISRVIIATGHILVFTLCKYLEENKIMVSIDVKSSLLAKDKIAYKDVLKAQGFSTPSYLRIGEKEEFVIDNIIAELKLPCVVKSSIDKTLPQLANSKEELIRAIKEVQAVSDVLAEEYIIGVDCTVPVICNYRDTKALFVSYYSKAKECHLKGFRNFQQEKLSAEKEEELKQVAQSALSTTGIIGMARVDIMVDKNDGMYILECNSVMVTGINQRQREYGIMFLQKENVNFAELLVKNAFIVFQQKKLCGSAEVLV